MFIKSPRLIAALSAVVLVSTGIYVVSANNGDRPGEPTITTAAPSTTSEPAPTTTEQPVDPSAPNDQPLPELPPAPDNPNGRTQLFDVQQTPLSSKLWNLDRVDAKGDERYEWDTTGKGVTVFVIDSGVTSTADLGERLLPGKSFVANDTSTADCHGHGTHVAGTIAGKTHGVAKNATVVPVRVVGCNGSGSMSAFAQGVEWAVANKPAGPAILSVSMGGPADRSVEAAFDKAVQKGFTVSVAAGNANANQCTTNSPARMPALITVGALDKSNRRASFSNFGPCLDLWGPGVDILSSTPRGGSTLMSGTSMSTPYVSGLAARVLERTPGASMPAVLNELSTKATQLTVDKGSAKFAVLPIAGTAPVTTTTQAPATTTTRAPAPTTTRAPSATSTTAARNTPTTIKPPTSTTTAAPRPAPPRLNPGEIEWNGRIYTWWGKFLRYA